MISLALDRNLKRVFSVHTSSMPAVAADSALICLIALVSALPYLGHLGFYSDDWGFLATLASAHDHSFAALFTAVNGQVEARPVQAAYLAGMYMLFGTDALGYQLVATALLCAAGPLAYLALREFGFSRPVAVLVAAIYTTLPNYSTDRLWMAAAQSLISACFFFLSMYALGRAARRTAWGYWLAGSAAALLVSGLAYEVFLPLFVVAAVLLPTAVRVPARRRTLICAVIPILVVVIGIFKVAVTTRLGGGGLLERMAWLLHFAKAELVINFGEYGVGLPLMAMRLFVSRPLWSAAAAGVAAAVIVYAWVLSTRHEAFGSYRRLTLAGAACFIAGYAVFVTNPNAMATATGSGNRVAIASAFGMALLFVATVAWVRERFAGPRIRTYAVGVLTAIVVGSGVLTNTTLAWYWQEAATQQATVLRALKRDAPTLPANSTIVLDGICPYVGPGVIFEATWDVGGALRVLYGSPTISGDVVTPRMSIEAEGLRSYTYQFVTVHPYGERLLVYDYRSRSLTKLTSAADAVAYFASHPSPACASGWPGDGARVI